MPYLKGFQRGKSAESYLFIRFFIYLNDYFWLIPTFFFYLCNIKVITDETQKEGDEGSQGN